MFRAYGPGPSLWESVLPEAALRMPAELVRVDELLSDPVFFGPFRPFFSPFFGRPSIPMETFLRMMFLKHRYRIGFESLCWEVTDSVSWSRFCRIPLGGSVPHHSTLKKLAKRCGPETTDRLNEALLVKAAEKKVLRTDRLRADTTVVPGDVGYPTDSGLMARGVIRLVALVAALHGLGLATRTTMRDRSRSMRRRAHDMGAWLRRRSDQAHDEARAINEQMAARRRWPRPAPWPPTPVEGFTVPALGCRAKRSRRWASWTRPSIGSVVSSNRPGDVSAVTCPSRRPGW